MKINDKRISEVEFQTLRYGDLFEYTDQVCVKCNNSASGANAVRLNDGILFTLRNVAKVKALVGVLEVRQG